MTIKNKAGDSSDRVLSMLNSDDKLYVAVNHWPRTWYYQVLDHPQVLIDLGEGQSAYRAVQVTDEAEHNQVDNDNPLPPVFKALTGFPPRYFIRLEAQ